MTSSSSRPLFEHWPSLRARVPLAELAELPTPVESLRAALVAVGCERDDVYAKRDDRSSPVYGGNKVRTLEVLFGAARAKGATHIFSTGAFGSNHATATILHAPRAGLEPGAILFPQPVSQTALDNLRVTVARGAYTHGLLHWSQLPFAMVALKRWHALARRRVEVMVPGGATPLGALGYVSAALELGHQIADGAVPRPSILVVGVGSNCTTAGLLVGLLQAARLGVGFVTAEGRPAPPRIVAVRVTPWPVTSRVRILGLAVRTSRLLAELSGDAGAALSARELRPWLRLEGDYLGRGYGKPTEAGREAVASFRRLPDFELDTTYSAKAAAALLALARAGEPGPLLFWSTKSTAPLPSVDDAELARAPLLVRTWTRWAEERARREARPVLPADSGLDDATRPR